MSIEALNWARKIYCGPGKKADPMAKSLLRAIADYASDDGLCYASMKRLAADCEISVDSVRRRLRTLEERGIITTFRCWLDDHGKRNYDGLGRETTRDIRLPLEMVRVRSMFADGEIGDDEDGDTPLATSKGGVASSEGGHRPGGDSSAATPGVAVGPPLNELSSNEVNPPTPQMGGGALPPNSEGQEPEDFAAAWSAWRAPMRRDLALIEFRLLSPEKQKLCRAAVPLFNAKLDQLGRTRVPNFHLWIRTRGFEEFPHAVTAASAPASSSVDANSAAGRAITALYRMARVPLFESRGHVVYPLEVTLQVLAFADAGPHASWPWIEDRQQIAAWAAFVAAHVHRPGQMLQTRGVGEGQRSGIHAPWPWPPRKDGSLSAEEKTGDAA